MNILFLYPSNLNEKTGGVQAVAVCLDRYFCSQGHKVWRLAWQHYDGGIADIDILPDQRHVLSKINKTYIDDYLQNHPIDIVMNHTALSPAHSVVLRHLKHHGLKIVTVFHNSPFGMYGISNFPRLQNISIRWMRVVINKAIHMMFYVKYHRLLRMQVKNSDHVYMLSEKFIPEYEFFIGKDFHECLSAMPNPLLTENLPETEKKNILLYVGRLSHEKGLPYLLDIWNILSSQHPDWELKIVGDGAKRAYCEERIKRERMPRVSMYGFQNPNPFYNEAKLFCMTSLFEGFGLVLIEAMHYGTVPVAFQSYPNIGDIVSNGKSGFLVAPFNVEQYANMLSLLMDNPTLLDTMSAMAKEKAKEYNVEHIGNKWLDIFRDIIM